MTSRFRTPRRSTGVWPTQALPPFQRFLDEHREPVLRFLVAAAGPRDAEDCFQETFLSALRAYPRVAPGSNLRSWVMTIAYRKAMDAHRARARAPVPVEDVPEDVVEPSLPEPELWARVRELPAGQRGAVVLRYVADLPFAEIATVLGCSEEAGRQRVRAGLERLRKETVT